MAGTKVVITFEVANDAALTKIREVGRELGAIETSTTRTAGGMGALRGALAGVALAAGAVVAVGLKRFISESMAAAAEEQAVFASLATTLNNVGVSYNDVSVELQKMFDGLQKTTAFASGDAASAFNVLVRITRDYEDAQKLLGVTLDIAATKGTNAAAAAELVGRAVEGNAFSLRSLVPDINKATLEQLKLAAASGDVDRALAILTGAYGGQAAAQLDTYSGKVRQLSNYWKDLKIAFGSMLASLATAGGKFGTMVDVLENVKDAILDLGEYLYTVFNVDYSAFFAAALNNIQAEFKLFVVGLNDKLKILPDWLGGGAGATARANAAFQEYLRIIDEFGKNTDNAVNDAIKAAAEWRKQVENLIFTSRGQEGGGGFSPDLPDDMKKTIENWGKALGEAWGDELEGIDWFPEDKIIHWIGDNPISDEKWQQMVSQFGAELERTWARDLEGRDFYPDEIVGDMSEGFEVIGEAFSDMLGKGFMGELESFGDLWNEIWEDLAKSMVGIITDAFVDALENGWGRLKGTFEEMSAATRIGGAIAGLGMVASAYQQGGGTGAILQGMMGGALTGAMWAAPAGGIGAGVGAIIGAVIGGVIAALGSQAAEDPETFVQNLGLTTGLLQTRGHQGYTAELQALWIKQQQSIMRSYLQGYRQLLSLFEDKSLFELIGAMPTFSTTGWTGMGADQLAQWLQKEFWPSAFMDMFQAAIGAGLEGLGVTSGTLDQLWTELEALPGEERMGALTTYVRSLVDLTRLMGDMDWNAIMDAVGMNSMQVFMSGIEEIAGTIQTLMFALDDMTLLERAEQAEQIEELIIQVRQAEIQYLQQLDQLQKSINESIASQIEQLQLGGLGAEGQRTYYQQRIADIMAQLAGGGITSPEQLQQLMADLQRYIAALAQSLGEQLYDPMDVMGWGQTWADYLTGILQQAQGYSDAYFEQFRDEIRTANDELIDAIRDLIDALTGATAPRMENVAGLNIGQGGNVEMIGGGGTQVNVYLEGTMSALRPFVRAEIRDSMAGRARGIN